MSDKDDTKGQEVQADDKSIAIGSIDIGGNVSGSITIGHAIGYTAEEVSVLIEQISTTFEPKKFDGRCPYKGLDVFEEEDSELFFGRENLVTDIVGRMRDSRMVFITGPSGSGKSSLVRAGLIPSLKQGVIKNSDRWLYETIIPGRDPSESMALAFSRLKSPELGKYFRENIHQTKVLLECTESVLSGQKDQHLVLFIDQFEEVFTQVSREEQRAVFLNLLTHAAKVENGRVVILFSMRSDFVSNCATYPQLNDLLNQQFVQIGAMQPDELVSAIAQPALRVGLRIDPDLIAQIINDMEGEPGALPLMQFALKDLFDEEQAKGGMIALTRQAYLQRGGIQKSLERHADASFAKLEKHEQELARSIFSGLIEIGRGTQDTRRTALFDELIPASAKEKDIEAIVSKLADARLITTDEQAGKDMVTISHEKLIDAWPWLKKLVNENRDVIALQNEIAGDANVWEEQKRDASYLYRGVRLANAREQLEAKKLVLSGTAYEFVKAGFARQRRDKLARIFSISAIISLAIVGVLLFSYISTTSSKKLAEQSEIFANTQQAIASTSQANAEEAQNQAKKALSRQLAAQSQSIFATGNSKQMTAVLLAVQSMNMFPSDPSIEAIQVLQNNILAQPISSMTHERILWSVAFSPDGKFVVSGSGDRTARVWEAATGKEIARITHDRIVRSVAFSPNGTYVVSGSDDGSARVWEASTGNEIARMTHDGNVNAVVFSPDGRYVVSGSDDGTARVWEASTGKEIALMTHDGTVNTVAWSPDGQYVISGSSDSSIKVWDAATSQEIAHMSHDGKVNFIAISPNGKYIVSGSDDFTARVWELATGNEIARTSYDDIVNSVAFSPDSRFVVSGSGDHFVEVWEATTGKQVSRMIHDSNVSVVTFSSDGKYVVSGSRDGTARVWEASTGHEVVRMTHDNRVNSLAISADGKLIVTGSEDNVARVWVATLGKEVARMPLDARVWSVAFSPDGKYVASGSGDNTARVWEMATGKEVARITNSDSVNSVAFSPDSRYLAGGSGSLDHTARVWEVSTGKEVAHMVHDERVNSVAFSPDGKYVVSGSWDHTARVWEAETGKEIARMTHEDEVRCVAFSPDGKYVVSGSLDRTVRMWETATGKEVAHMNYDGSVNSVAFSPDGRFIVSGTGNQIVHVWEIATGEEVLQMTHDSNVRSVAFSPDSQYILSGSRDYTVRVWDVSTGKEVTRMIHDDRVNSVAFSPDGKYVVTGGEDNVVRIWVWRPEDILEKACTRLIRNLSQAEWEQYLGGEQYQPVCPNLPLEPELTSTESP